MDQVKDRKLSQDMDVTSYTERFYYPDTDPHVHCPYLYKLKDLNNNVHKAIHKRNAKFVEEKEVVIQDILDRLAYKTDTLERYVKRIQ